MCQCPFGTPRKARLFPQESNTYFPTDSTRQHKTHWPLIGGHWRTYRLTLSLNKTHTMTRAHYCMHVWANIKASIEICQKFEHQNTAHSEAHPPAIGRLPTEQKQPGRLMTAGPITAVHSIRRTGGARNGVCCTGQRKLGPNIRTPIPKNAPPLS